MLLFCLVWLGLLPGTYSRNENSIIVYCAAGVRGPVEELVNRFENEQDQDLTVIDGSSGELLAQIKTQGKGDVFIPGDPAFFEDLSYSYKYLLGYHYPVVVVNEDGATNKGSFQGLAYRNLNFVRVDLEMAAIGKATEKVIRDSAEGKAMEVNLHGQVARATQVPLYVSLIDNSAGLTWYSNYLSYEDELELVELPAGLKTFVPIKAATLEKSEQITEAREFITYMNNTQGQYIFEQHGYALEIED